MGVFNSSLPVILFKKYGPCFADNNDYTEKTRGIMSPNHARCLHHLNELPRSRAAKYQNEFLSF